MNEINTLNELHMELHVLRRSNPKSVSQFETRVGYLICEYFKDNCSECRMVLEDKRKKADEMVKGNVSNTNNKSFLDKVLGK